jgi:Uma2 family endonuclease
MSDLAVLAPNDDGFTRKKWTVDECRFLVENGLIDGGKFELIDGEIIYKIGQGRLHVAVITGIIAVLSALFGADSIQSQAPIGIGQSDPYSDPEPDVAVLRGTVEDYVDLDPRPDSDILLVVEASNTTVIGDTTTKARLYAANGVQEYWVVVIPRRELIVFRSPADGEYADVRTWSEGQLVSPLARPESEVSVTSLLTSRKPL